MVIIADIYTILVISTSTVTKKDETLELSRLEYQNAVLKMQVNAQNLYITKVFGMWRDISTVITEVCLYFIITFLFCNLCPLSKNFTI